MAWLDAFLMGLLEGFTQYLPLSSFGHALWAMDIRGISAPPLLLAVMLQLGGAMAVLVVYWRDFYRVLTEALSMLTDCISNAYIYFHNRRTPDHHVPYNRVVVGTWRVITFLLLLSSAITALLGYLARNLVAKAVSSPLLLGAFFLVTGLFLLVTDLSRVGGRKSAKEAGPETGIWLGIAQGVASFPGISRFGLTFCAGLMCGLSRRFMAKFSCMMSVPASIGASFLIWDAWSDPALTADAAQGIVMAAFVAFICGLFLCKTIVKLFAKAPLVAFALYDMAFGGVILLRAFR